jgi:hypothetical protein
MRLGDDCCSFSGPLQRAGKDKAQRLSLKSLGYSARLAVSFFGQGNVGYSLAASFPIPKGLAVADEVDCEASIRCH